MKKLSVLLLVHEDLIPPDTLEGLDEAQVEYIKTEYDVSVGLDHLGHEVRSLGLAEELAPLRKAIQEWKPDIVFNLLEEFDGQAVYDQNVVAYLELMRAPYTGCNPRGLIVTRDKALSKKILHYHRIATPQFMVVARGRQPRRPKRLQFPLIVKSLIEEASLGISQASVVHNDEKLAERVRFIHEHVQTDAIVEQFIDGREVYCAIVGNERLQALPVWELRVEATPAGTPWIATRKVKWDLGYQERHGVKIGRARDLTTEQEQHIQATGKRIYRILGMEGYGRVDFRLRADGKLFFLEANPNCDIARDEEMASAAEEAGLDYPQLLQKIVNLGLRRAGR